MAIINGRNTNQYFLHATREMKENSYTWICISEKNMKHRIRVIFLNKHARLFRHAILSLCTFSVRNVNKLAEFKLQR